jgi:hypothetical protein
MNLCCHVTILMTIAGTNHFFLKQGLFSKRGTIAGIKTLFFTRVLLSTVINCQVNKMVTGHQGSCSGALLKKFTFCRD